MIWLPSCQQHLDVVEKVSISGRRGSRDKSAGLYLIIVVHDHPAYLAIFIGAQLNSTTNMAPITSNRHHYSSLANDETEISSFIQDTEKTGIRFDLENKISRQKLRTLLPWLVHVVFILAYGAVYVYLQRPAGIIEGFACECCFTRNIVGPNIITQRHRMCRLSMKQSNSTIFFQGTSTHSKGHRPLNQMLLGHNCLMVNRPAAETYCWY